MTAAATGTQSARPILDVENLVKHFPAGGKTVHAVNDVSFSIRPSEIVGMVGESGSGKSTIGRLAVSLLGATSGKVAVEGADLAGLKAADLRALRARMQIVFQDPWSALNPRMSVGRQIGEPLVLHTDLSRSARRQKVEELAKRVQLPIEFLSRAPSELSGGQLQRVCIARAIATDPALIVLDEPTSSLDLSVRAGILDLLAKLRAELGVAMLFISHDLGTVKLVSDRIVVLYLGTVVEEGPAATVFNDPAHPYTQALLSAHLPPDPAAKLSRHVLEGEVPSPINLPEGCRFSSRCPLAIDACRRELPKLIPAGPDGRRAACLRIESGENRLSL
ncbi:ABC transporter ATP-binding protein [Acuticoccus sp. MNP-M23]|uniref:ABC transporter ATP-binding protein n=1 Tax=Acuticoccus sp. MNP-M23 TaxID=3072793 RepID=UPI002814BF6B|nr:ABC transporter ATP-binding protein [Acuticoccus sp. MNP-M23]WMS42576.1 ABC transporter ATP-binding protein [Acuticoccus sp. MNP-M23]